MGKAAQRFFQSLLLAAAYDRLRESPAAWNTCGLTFGRKAALHGAALAGAPGLRWLEVACGQRSFGLAALRSVDGARLVGLDLSGAQLQRAAAKSRRLGLTGRHRRVRGDALRLPFADGRFTRRFASEACTRSPSPPGWCASRRACWSRAACSRAPRSCCGRAGA